MDTASGDAVSSGGPPTPSAAAEAALPAHIMSAADALVWLFSQPAWLAALVRSWHSAPLLPTASSARVSLSLMGGTGSSPFPRIQAQIVGFFERLFAGERFAFEMVRLHGLRLFDSPQGLLIPRRLLPRRFQALFSQSQITGDLASLAEALNSRAEGAVPNDCFLDRGRLLAFFYAMFDDTCVRLQTRAVGAATLGAATDQVLAPVLEAEADRRRAETTELWRARYKGAARDGSSAQSGDPARGPLDRAHKFYPLVELRAELIRAAAHPFEPWIRAE